MAKEFVKSYTCNVGTRGQLEVKSSHLAVGYSKAHRATPEEAKQAFIDKAQEEIKFLEDAIDTVRESLEPVGT